MTKAEDFTVGVNADTPVTSPYDRVGKGNSSSDEAAKGFGVELDEDAAVAINQPNIGRHACTV